MPTHLGTKASVIVLAILVTGCTSSNTVSQRMLQDAPATSTAAEALLDYALDTHLSMTLTEMRIMTENVRRHSVHSDNCVFMHGISRVSNATITATWEAGSQAASRLALLVDDPERQIIFAATDTATSPLTVTLQNVTPDPSSGLLRAFVFVNETTAIAEQPVDLHIQLAYSAEREAELTNGICSQV